MHLQTLWEFMWRESPLLRIQLCSWMTLPCLTSVASTSQFHQPTFKWGGTLSTKCGIHRLAKTLHKILRVQLFLSPYSQNLAVQQNSAKYVICRLAKQFPVSHTSAIQKKYRYRSTFWVPSHTANNRYFCNILIFLRLPFLAWEMAPPWIWRWIAGFLVIGDCGGSIHHHCRQPGDHPCQSSLLLFSTFSPLCVQQKTVADQETIHVNLHWCHINWEIIPCS